METPQNAAPAPGKPAQPARFYRVTRSFILQRPLEDAIKALMLAHL